MVASLSEYKKDFLGEMIKLVIVGIGGAILTYFSQQWFISDLEYKQSYKNAYLSSALGHKGLTMAFDGKPLKNVSVVEFELLNRTSKQISNADLLFTIDDEGSPILVSSEILPPKGISSTETIEELKSKDIKAKKFRIRVVPKQLYSEYFHAVFVFEGEKTPLMSLSSASGDVSVIPYQYWKDQIKAIVLLFAMICLFGAITGAIVSFLEHWLEPRRHRKQVERFNEFAKELLKEGKLQTKNPEMLSDSGIIYASFTRPKSSKFWSKIFGDQKFEY